MFALLYQLWHFAADERWLLIVMDLLVLCSAIMVVLEATGAFVRERRRLAAAEVD